MLMGVSTLGTLRSRELPTRLGHMLYVQVCFHNGVLLEVQKNRLGFSSGWPGYLQAV